MTAWSPNEIPTPLIAVAIAVGAAFLLALLAIGGSWLLHWVSVTTGYHSRAAKHAAKAREDNPDKIRELLDVPNYPTAYPAMPADQRPDGRPA